MTTTVTVPATITANTKPTAANINTYRDGLQQLQGLTPTGGGGALDFFIGRQTSSSNRATGTTLVAMALDTEDVDTASGHAAAAANYTVQTAGYVEVDLECQWAANATHSRYLGIILNGSDAGRKSTQGSSDGAVVFNQSYGTIIAVSAGDTIALGVAQDTGGNLLCNSSRMVVRWVHS